MQTAGNYNLAITIGDTLIPIQPQMIKELFITQDIDLLLPTFKMTIMDSTGLLGEIIPHDSDANKVTFKITGVSGENSTNQFVFMVKKRRFSSAKEYTVEGVLFIEGMLDPPRTRALSGSVRNNIHSIATDELGINNTEIGASLDVSKILLQPTWTNAQLFRYLKDKLLGAGDASGFHCFIKNIDSTPTLVFKSIGELTAQEPSFNFMIGYKQYEDYLPVNTYHVIDNSQILGDFGSRYQAYRYFDFMSGTKKSKTIDITDYPSLAEQFLVDNSSSIQGKYDYFGRNSDFSSELEGAAKNGYYHRLTGLVNMWISTWGTENVAPGDIVKVVFNDSFASGDFYLFQHSGYWLVKRVVHVLTTSFMTNLLLTRSGIDSSIENTLLPAVHYKR